MLRSPRVQSRQRLKRRRKPRAGTAHRPLRRDRLGSPQKHRREQNGSGKTPQRSSPTSSAQPNGNQPDLRGTERRQQSHVGGATRPGCRSEAYQSRSNSGEFFFGNLKKSYKDRLGEWQKKTAWHRVQVWGALAETVSASLRQGARVFERKAHHPQLDRQAKPEAPLHRSGGQRYHSYAGSKQWSAKRERARRPSIPAISNDRELGAIAGLQSGLAPSFLRLIS